MLWLQTLIVWELYGDKNIAWQEKCLKKEGKKTVWVGG